MMNAQEIRDAIAADPGLQALVSAGDHESVARALSDMQPAIARTLRVDEVFDILYATGDYTSLKQAQLAGDPRAVLAFAALADARALGSGTVDLSLPTTATLLDSLEEPPALIKHSARTALSAAAVTRPPAITHEAVTAALKE